MTKQHRDLVLSDFLKERSRLDLIVNNTRWLAKTIVIPFLTSEGIPVSARYGYKEMRWLEINVISEDNKLEYIKL